MKSAANGRNWMLGTKTRSGRGGQAHWGRTSSLMLKRKATKMLSEEDFSNGHADAGRRKVTKKTLRAKCTEGHHIAEWA